MRRALWQLALLVAALLAAIGSIAVPNLHRAIERGKQKRAMSEVRILGTAVESYQVDHGVVPEAQDVDALAEILVPVWIRDPPRRDPWGTPYRYRSWRVEAGFLVPGPPNLYVLGSAGSDRAWEHEEVGDYPGGAGSSLADDLVFGGYKLAARP